MIHIFAATSPFDFRPIVDMATTYMNTAISWAISAGMATISGMLVLGFVTSIFRK